MYDGGGFEWSFYKRFYRRFLNKVSRLKSLKMLFALRSTLAHALIVRLKLLMKDKFINFIRLFGSDCCSAICPQFLLINHSILYTFQGLFNSMRITQ